MKENNHKKPVVLPDFDPLYLKIYLEFSKAVKTTGSLVKGLQNKVNLTKTCFTPPPPRPYSLNS